MFQFLFVVLVCAFVMYIHRHTQIDRPSTCAIIIFINVQNRVFRWGQGQDSLNCLGRQTITIRIFVILIGNMCKDSVNRRVFLSLWTDLFCISLETGFTLCNQFQCWDHTVLQWMNAYRALLSLHAAREPFTSKRALHAKRATICVHSTSQSRNIIHGPCALLLLCACSFIRKASHASCRASMLWKVPYHA